MSEFFIMSFNMMPVWMCSIILWSSICCQVVIGSSNSTAIREASKVKRYAIDINRPVGNHAKSRITPILYCFIVEETIQMILSYKNINNYMILLDVLSYLLCNLMSNHSGGTASLIKVEPAIPNMWSGFTWWPFLKDITKFSKTKEAINAPMEAKRNIHEYTSKG